MGLPELISALEREAETELAEHRRTRAAQADRVRADAAAQAGRMVARAVADAERETTARVRRGLADGREQAAGELRREREDALDAVFAAARDRLAQVRAGPGYADVLSACLDEALAAVPGVELVRADRRDADRVSALLAGRDRPVRLVADLTCWGGVVAAAPGRSVDNTLEERLRSAWPQLRSALAGSWAADDREVPS